MGIPKNLPFPLFCRRRRIFRGRGIKGEVKIKKLVFRDALKFITP